MSKFDSNAASNLASAAGTTGNADSPGAVRGPQRETAPSGDDLEDAPVSVDTEPGDPNEPPIEDLGDGGADVETIEADGRRTTRRAAADTGASAGELGIDPDLVIAAEQHGWTEDEIKDHVAQFGAEKTAKAFGKYRDALLAGEFSGDGPADQAADDRPNANAAASDAARGAATAADPSQLLAKLRPFDDAAMAKLKERHGEDFHDDVLAPMNKTIGELRYVLQQQAAALEQQGRVLPQIMSFQSAEMKAREAEYERKLGGWFDKMSGRGFASLYGTGGKLTPEQKRARDELAGSAARIVKTTAGRIRGDEALLRAHLARTGNKGTTSDAVKTVQQQIAKRARQISAPPGGPGTGGTRDVEFDTEDSQRNRGLAAARSFINSRRR